MLYIKPLYLPAMLILMSIASFAQDKKDPPAEDSTYLRVLDYSRPGKSHELLAALVGSWKFEGSRLEWVDSVTSKPGLKLAGSLVRRSFADGRFFIAELTTPPR